MKTRVRCTRLLTAVAGAGLIAFGSSASAVVVSAGDSGFEVLEAATVAASPRDAYARLVDVAAWWNKAHTFSGDAANLSLEARAGGCFCERLKEGGSVQHLVVVYVAPNQTVRLSGALGPLQALGVSGSMTISLAAAGNDTEVSIRYRVGGYTTDGIRKWAGPVDEVLGEQLARLKRLIEIGNAEPPTSPAPIKTG